MQLKNFSTQAKHVRIDIRHELDNSKLVVFNIYDHLYMVKIITVWRGIFLNSKCITDRVFRFYVKSKQWDFLQPFLNKQDQKSTRCDNILQCLFNVLLYNFYLPKSYLLIDSHTQNLEMLSHLKIQIKFESGRRPINSVNWQRQFSANRKRLLTEPPCYI